MKSYFASEMNRNLRRLENLGGSTRKRSEDGKAVARTEFTCPTASSACGIEMPLRSFCWRGTLPTVFSLAPECVSWEILDPVKLMMKTHHHSFLVSTAPGLPTNPKPHALPP